MLHPGIAPDGGIYLTYLDARIKHLDGDITCIGTPRFGLAVPHLVGVKTFTTRHDRIQVRAEGLARVTGISKGRVCQVRKPLSQSYWNMMRCMLPCITKVTSYSILCMTRCTDLVQSLLMIMLHHVVVSLSDECSIYEE